MTTINTEHEEAECQIVIDDDSVDLEIVLDAEYRVEAVLTFEEFAALLKAIEKIPAKVRERILR